MTFSMTSNNDKLNIAIVGNPLRRIDEDAKLGYAGTERVNRILIKELIRRGHSVKYFGPGDSKTPATVIPTVPIELWSDDRYEKLSGKEKTAMYFDSVRKTLDTVYEHFRSDFDTIVHFSVDQSLSDRRFDDRKTVSTMHGDTSFSATQETFSNPATQKRNIIFVSYAQRSFLPQAHCVGVIHNATELDGVRPSFEPGRYLVEVCRLSAEKAPHIPILVAEKLGFPIEIIGPDPKTAQSDVYLSEVFWPIYKRAHAKGLANYRGRVKTEEKDRIIKGAAAGFMLSGMYLDNWIQPHRYIEAFGLTSIEYQKYGTPSVTSIYGACPETVSNGRTGYVCSTEDEVFTATKRVLNGDIDRRECPSFVRENFSPAKMADGYEMAYRLVEMEYGSEQSSQSAGHPVRA